MDALSLLKEDHDRVKRMLSDLDSTTERGIKTRKEGFAKLVNELEIHETIEEEIFYPALKEHSESREIVLEGYEEHNAVDMVIAEIKETPFDDETWGAKFTVMKENIEHHIEEEEGDMFKQARDVLDEEKLEELGKRMAERKDQLQNAA